MRKSCLLLSVFVFILYFVPGAHAAPPQIDWTKYHNHADVTTILKDFADEYENLCKVYSIGKSFQGITEEALATAISQFEKRFSGDVENLRKSVLKLDVSDTGEPDVELQKKFIHLWLKLLDQEIMEL